MALHRTIALTIAALGLSACAAAPDAAAPSQAAAAVPPRPPAPEADGRVHGKITPADVHPAITNLDPRLRKALRQAAAAASADGVEIHVTSGWRSAAYQRRLLQEAATKYGSLEEARRFVLPPEKSAHVKGRAVDIGPPAAADWLGRHGATFGLCQIYANEKWHFERATTPGGHCPEKLPDATAG
ncbi:M15 family metallopeptidase [Actinomadura macrotermitis]|uniref:D-alanyl-D-alanine carboxypeptidase-like core domain-containing protein n=1 Tax=Actinomadura macrotermitis TaxID=2585200 RepID=A0A7K0BR49_9ACTN|nr:M15 family metallopeptidase [Actinomadura macrotermitis]MQY03663.1 hypothetical protein [Actinomadura macrotermitis]